MLNWLNGNKTIFGLILSKLTELIPPDYQFLGFIPVHTVLAWLAGILMTVGVTHKIIKASNGTPSPT